MNSRIFGLCTLLLFAATGVSFGQETVSLERALVRRAPKVIKYLEAKQYRNVGVLKFLVTTDGKALSDNVGPLNMRLAWQLERSLILRNNPRKPIGIIANASAVAAKISGANHLSKSDRAKLFSRTYPLAWGQRNVTPDAFITGAAQISKDRGTVTVSLFVFDRKQNRLTELGAGLTAALGARQLVEAGESFLFRGLFDGGDTTVTTEKAAKHAKKVRQQKVVHPVQDKAAPISLKVFYAGQEIKPELSGGKAFIPSPKEGQKVWFELAGTAKKGRFGVVLKVNGENTLARQRLPDELCRMWVIGAGEGPYTIQGYQMDDNTALTFRVASKQESRAREIDYGADVGTITMTVFREGKRRLPKLNIDPEETFEKSVQKADHPVDLPRDSRPKNFDALKAQLIAEANRGRNTTRSIAGNLIVDGHKIKSKLHIVTFRRDPIPVMSVTIVYYRKGR